MRKDVVQKGGIEGDIPVVADVDVGLVAAEPLTSGPGEAVGGFSTIFSRIWPTISFRWNSSTLRIARKRFRTLTRTTGSTNG